MRPTLYQASRMLTTVGVTADITFNPTQITNRLRKSIQRQIVNGIITGGWSSHASRLAKVLCEQHKLPYLANSWHGVEVQAKTKETQERLVELVQADTTAYLLTDSGSSLYFKAQARKTVAAIRAGERTYVRIHDKEFDLQIRQVLIKSRSTEELGLALKVSALLDSPNPISIDQQNWKD